MSAELLHFPVRAPLPAPAPASSSRQAIGQQAASSSRQAIGRYNSRRTYDFADMVRLNGLDSCEPRTQVDHLRLLAEQCGLPAPRNPRVHAGRVLRGSAAIGRRSVWGAPEVDAWLDGQHTPPPAADALPPPAAPAVRAECAARARMLASA